MSLYEVNKITLVDKILVVPSGGGRMNRDAQVVVDALRDLGYGVEASALPTRKADLMDIVHAAVSAQGRDREWSPLFPNFTDRNQSMNSFINCLHQIVHYLSHSRPQTRDLARGVKASNIATLTVVDSDTFIGDLVKEHSARSAGLTKRDMALITALASFDGFVDSFNRVFTSWNNGEVASAWINAKDANGTFVFPDAVVLRTMVRNADDLLRIVLARYSVVSPYSNNREAYDRAVVHLSDKDSSHVVMTSAPKAFRRGVAYRLADVCSGYEADRLIRRNRLWRKVAKSLHLGDFDVARREFDIINGNVEYRTFNSDVEKAIADDDARGFVTLLAMRPGMLMSRVVKAASMCVTKRDVTFLLETLLDKGVRAPIKNVIAARGAVTGATGGSAINRAAGRNAHVRSETIALSDDARVAITAILDKVLSIQLGRIDAPKGPVGIKGADFPFPTVVRDSSAHSSFMFRGQSVELGDDDAVRVFMHWYNTDDRSIDLDLAMAFYDEDKQHVDTVSWNSLGDVGYSRFSGDLTNAPRPRGAAEFIDIYRNEALARGVRYGVMTVTSYTGTKMSNIDHMYGVAPVDSSDGQNFDTSTAKYTATCESPSTMVVACVIDLVDNVFRSVDTVVDSVHCMGSFVRNSDSVHAILDSMGSGMTVAEVLTLWAEAHGQTVDETVDVDMALVRSMI